ncbi:Hypothetical predicted protein [Olea europaea subsp. europaea]|uniref:Uncharacterized protein n=1 Tax=Olea europaea subsp. europaea TaxID=158383 RepID=A0A8S0TIZ0_OLEEU|nr:Hypothetical predicted protein [Olea europaea subsp. europaea]
MKLWKYRHLSLNDDYLHCSVTSVARYAVKLSYGYRHGMHGAYLSLPIMQNIKLRFEELPSWQAEALGCLPTYLATPSVTRNVMSHIVTCHRHFESWRAGYFQRQPWPRRLRQSVWVCM